MAKKPGHSPYREVEQREPAKPAEALYAAQDLVDAQMIVDRLREADIAVRVTGTHLAGALGELPYGDTLPRIWLEDASDREAALVILQEYEARRNAGDDSTLVCPSCAEENPGNFELCWSCRAELV